MSRTGRPVGVKHVHRELEGSGEDLKLDAYQREKQRAQLKQVLLTDILVVAQGLEACADAAVVRPADRHVLAVCTRLREAQPYLSEICGGAEAELNAERRNDSSEGEGNTFGHANESERQSL